jgi:hypothetical protein
MYEKDDKRPEFRLDWLIMHEALKSIEDSTEADDNICRYCGRPVKHKIHTHAEFCPADIAIKALRKVKHEE